MTTGPGDGNSGTGPGPGGPPRFVRNLIDLWPGARPNRWALLERACELIEQQPGWFSHRDLHDGLGRWPVGSGAAHQVIRELLGHGLLERDGKHGNTRYRVRTGGPR